MSYNYPTVIVDDFFETPTLVREWALGLNYLPAAKHPSGGYWSGVRATPLLHENDYRFHQKLAQKLIQYIPHATYFEKLDATFHVCTDDYESGWIHRDDDDYGIGGLIYLNETNPQNCGTILYDVPSNDDSINYEKEFKSNVTTDDIELRKRLNKMRVDCNKHFTPNTSVEARFNRCIIFDGRKYHSGGDYFGNDITTGRLTLVFFGKVL